MALCKIKRPSEYLGGIILDSLWYGEYNTKYISPYLVAGLCVHAAHQVIAGCDPYEIYEKHAKPVTYAHIGEIGKENRGALSGEGILDQKRPMKALLDVGYDGWMVIESSKEGIPPRDYAIHAKNYIGKQLLEPYRISRK